ncbi:MAG: outer membrane beta-barrel protein [Verrucomicrobiota bacterium]
MKISIISLTTLSALQAITFAGTHHTQQREMEHSSQPANVFNAGEFQLDAFGVYGVGKGPSHAGPFAEHAWGGGLGLNYFWTENLGVGMDVDILHGRENSARGNDTKDFGQYTASLIYRMPYEALALAPYAYAGGGVTSNAGTLASAHAGLGVEYRFVPNKIGLFADARWTYYGDRAGSGDQNNVQIRSGIRFVF